MNPLTCWRTKVSRVVALVSVSVWSAACSQGAVPVGPTSAGSAAGGARTERKVGEGVAPACDSQNPCNSIQGNLTFNAPSVQFSAATMGQADVSEPTWYTASTVFAVQPVGRLNDESIAVVLAVSAQLAHITVFRKVGELSEERIAGVAAPQLTAVADTACTSGQRLDTQFTVNLEKFGKTSVAHRHCR